MGVPAELSQHTTLSKIIGTGIQIKFDTGMILHQMRPRVVKQHYLINASQQIAEIS